MGRQVKDSSGCNRREFLGSSAKNAAGVAAGMVAPNVVALGQGSGEAGSPVRIAVVGVRNQGRKLVREFAQLPGSNVVAVCDVDDSILTSAVKSVEEVGQAAPEQIRDHRVLLDRNDIDAIVVATPNHWHEVMAREVVEADKHLYLEVPVTRTLGETDSLRQAADRGRKVIQTGLQQRSCSHFQSAIHYLRSGRLGRITMARAWTSHKRKPLAAVADRPCPEGIDYAAWLGPEQQPESPDQFNPNRFHFHWRWFWDYGGGELGDWGVHLLDTVAWGLNLGWPQQVSATGMRTVQHSPQQTPDTMSVQYLFDDCVVTWEHRQWCHYGSEGRSSAVAFFGERGMLILDRGGWKVYHQQDGPTESGTCQLSNHCQDFIRSIRESHAPNAGLAEGQLATELAHLGNLAYQLGQTVRCDPERRSLKG